MRKKKHFVPRRGIDIGFQILQMKKLFPWLKYCGRKWIGRIKPLERSIIFEVKIMYRNELPPKVFLVDPMPVKGTKHLYKDGSLCLYYPPDWEWSMHKSLAMTIVPWTYVWLYFYEIWLETGVWYGEEAPHPVKD
jgi:hypothetical protein